MPNCSRCRTLQVKLVVVIPSQVAPLYLAPPSPSACFLVILVIRLASLAALPRAVRTRWCDFQKRVYGVAYREQRFDLCRAVKQTMSVCRVEIGRRCGASRVPLTMDRRLHALESVRLAKSNDVLDEGSATVYQHCRYVLVTGVGGTEGCQR